jgi:FAD/FMN-containing dehydrogenase
MSESTWFQRFASITDATRVSVPSDAEWAIRRLTTPLAVSPTDAAEVKTILETARESSLGVLIVGAGTRAIARFAAQPAHEHIALLSTHLDTVLRIDTTALLVHAQAGVRLGTLERTLNAKGLTLGPLPACASEHTLGGALADPPVEAYTPLTGPLTSNCFALCAMTATGATIRTRAAPRAATGPHLGRTLLNSRGSLAMITSATIGVRYVPARETALRFRFATPQAAWTAASDIVAAEIYPRVLRVQLNPDTSLKGSNTDEGSGGAVLAAVLSGQPKLVAAQARYVEELTQRHAGTMTAAPQQHERSDPYSEVSPFERTCWRVSHARREAILATLFEQNQTPTPPCWIDQVDRHGANLWVRSVGGIAHLAVPLAAAAPSDALGGSATSDLTRRLGDSLDPDGVFALARRCAYGQQKENDGRRA